MTAPRWVRLGALAIVLFAGGCRDARAPGGPACSRTEARDPGEPDSAARAAEPEPSRDAEPRKDTEPSGKKGGNLHHLGMAGGFMLIMMVLMMAAMG